MSRKRPQSLLADQMRRRMPSREQMAENRWLAPIAHRFLSPELWRFTRRSVPRGVGLGLFCGFIVPLGQIFLAAFLALPLRANVPLACAVTFITNPLTFPFWLLVANRTGELVLGVDKDLGGAVLQSEGLRSFSAFFEAAGITVFGFVVLSIVGAAFGYFLAKWSWRVIVVRKRARRLLAMERRADAELEPGE